VSGCLSRFTVALGAVVLSISAAHAALNQLTISALPNGPATDVAYLKDFPGTAITLSGRQIYRTTDEGQTWKPTNFVAASDDARISVDPSDSRRVLVTGLHNAVEISSDAGVTFSTANLGQSPNEPSMFADASSDGSAWYVSTLNGSVYRSGDHGHSWELRGTAPGVLFGAPILVDPSDANHVYLLPSYVTEDLLSSNDGGQHWTALPIPCSASARCLDIAINPNNPANLIVASPNATYVSNNRGAAWTTVFVPTRIVKFDPFVPGRLLATYDRHQLLQSTDSGLNWSQFASPSNVDFARLSFNPNVSGRVLLSDYDGVYFSSTAGSAWELRMSGIISGDATGLALSDLAAEPVYATRGFYGLGLYAYRPSTRGSRWDERHS
jgi:photosystem II stability/assembly factor-like uncharacterized protein